MTKELDLESRIILAIAKNGKYYSDLRGWAERTRSVKRSLLNDRKESLLEQGLISEEFIKSGDRGRPKLRLFMSEGNRIRFEELFGKSI